MQNQNNRWENLCYSKLNTKIDINYNRITLCIIKGGDNFVSAVEIVCSLHKENDRSRLFEIDEVSITMMDDLRCRFCNFLLCGFCVKRKSFKSNSVSEEKLIPVTLEVQWTSLGNCQTDRFPEEIGVVTFAFNAPFIWKRIFLYVVACSVFRSRKGHFT